jgi:hypothetical protein
VHKLTPSQVLATANTYSNGPLHNCLIKECYPSFYREEMLMVALSFRCGTTNFSKTIAFSTRKKEGHTLGLDC